MNKYNLILLCLLLVLSSCREDMVIDTTDPVDPTETKYVKDIYGLIEDESGTPIQGVEMSIDGKSAFSNEYGLFSLKGVSVTDLRGTFMRASHSDYFMSGSRLYAKNTDKDYVKVVMVKKQLTATIPSGQPAIAVLDGGTQIEFLNGQMSYNGNAYNGQVNVYAYHLTPSTSNFLERSPGDLSAIDEDGQYGILRSYGMMAVELQGANGEVLELAAGSKAKITLPVPEFLKSEAPSTIPLWHFDEEKGIWVEEGEATLENGAFVGEVSHFSWWNCDDFLNPISLCIQIEIQPRGVLYSEAKVELTSSIYGVTCSYTDENGRICGLVPAGEVLTIRIFDICGAVIYEGEIGPYTTGPVEEIILPEISDAEIFQFVGKISECGTENGLGDAYISIDANGNKFYTQTNSTGNYNTVKMLCTSFVDYSLIAIHPSSGKSGYGESSGPPNLPLVLDIDLCEESPFVFIQDGTGQNLFQAIDVTIKVKPNETIIVGSDNNQVFIGGFMGASTGTFPISVLVNNITANQSSSNVTITQWGGVGSIIKGTFDLENGSITGSFAATRTE